MNKNFFLGYPVDFEGVCWIYPPKVKDLMANKDFEIYTKLLTLSQEEIEDEMVKMQQEAPVILTPLEYLLNLGYYNKDFEQKIKLAFKYFTHEECLILYEQKMIVLGDFAHVKSLKELRKITEENYFNFQNLIRESIGIKPLEPPNPNEPEKIRRMKAKARYRDKIKAKQKAGLKLETILASICCMNMGLNPLNIGELSYASVQTLVAVYQNKEAYELDMQSLLAGADKKKIKPKYWIRNLDD